MLRIFLSILAFITANAGLLLYLRSIALGEERSLSRRAVKRWALEMIFSVLLFCVTATIIIFTFYP